jgi:hypothetical protein
MYVLFFFISSYFPINNKNDTNTSSFLHPVTKIKMLNYEKSRNKKKDSSPYCILLRMIYTIGDAEMHEGDSSFRFASFGMTSHLKGKEGERRRNATIFLLLSPYINPTFRMSFRTK